MKFLFAFLAFFVLFLLQAPPASAQRRVRCVPWLSQCPRGRIIGRCRATYFRNRRRCPRICRRRVFGNRRNCFRRCRNVRIQLTRRGYLCRRRFNFPVPPVFPPTPPSPPSPVGCNERCYRWWRAASRSGCNLNVCGIRRCSFNRFGRQVLGWQCTRLTGRPTPTTPVSPSPTSSPRPSPNRNVCFGGCRLLVNARRNCDGRFCVNTVCRISNGIRYYSCIPRIALPTSSPSPSPTKTAAPGVTLSPSPLVPTVSPVVCEQLCRRVYFSTNSTCTRPQCAVVACTTRGTDRTGFGCIPKADAGGIDLTDFPRPLGTPSPSSTASPATVSPTVSVSPTASSMTVSPSVSMMSATPSSATASRISLELDGEPLKKVFGSYY